MSGCSASDMTSAVASEELLCKSEKYTCSNPSKGSKMSQTSAIVWLYQAKLFVESTEADLRQWMECACTSVLTTQLIMPILMLERD